nr:MAG TPA: hypothetical protein [Caudoviricetes sp.]
MARIPCDGRNICYYLGFGLNRPFILGVIMHDIVVLLILTYMLYCVYIIWKGGND